MELPPVLHGTLKKVHENTFPVISKLSKLLRLLMLIPATAGTVKQAQFSLKFVKNNLPSAISEDGMNVSIYIYIYIYIYIKFSFKLERLNCFSPCQRNTIQRLNYLIN